MAIQNARILIRRGNEVDFDANNMQPGEWALSTDEKIVRICVAPGVCIRMATYDAFEADMAKIEAILEQAKSIKEAVTLINTEVSENAKAVAEYTEEAKQYRDEAEQFRNEAEAFSPEGYSELVQNVEENTVKIDTILEKGGLTFDESASGENIHLTDTTDNKVTAFALYGKATQDGTPTPDAPVEIEVAGASGSVEVVSCGKNLANPNEFVIGGFNSGTGAEIERNDRVRTGFIKLKNSSFKESYQYETFVNMGTYYYDSDKNFIQLSGTVSKYSYIRKLFRNSDNTEITEEQFKKFKDTYIVVNSDDETIDYEPYKETLSTIPTENGLAGIPVSSGGNYTDENGQQWISDSIIKYADGTGKYVHRVGADTLGSYDYTASVFSGNIYSFISAQPISNALVSNSSKLLCETFIASGTCADNTMYITGTGNIRCFTSLYTNAEEFKTAMSKSKLYYELDEPIITDLSAEEIAEIEKLQTFYPVTNISNDAGCGMEIAYKADAKNYIDNIILARVATLETAVINNL